MAHIWIFRMCAHGNMTLGQVHENPWVMEIDCEILRRSDKR